jgi:cobalamin synthase
LSDDPAAKTDGVRSRQDDEALARVMRDVPRGALALSVLTVGLLLIAWLLIYALIFLPRGMVS